MAEGSDPRHSTSRAEQDIRRVVERWAVARDAGLWDELRATWHDEGRMRATWFDGDADAFVAACRQAFDAGVLVHHALAGSLIDVHGDRAVAQTKMSISQRADVHGVECDVTCIGRFHDLFARRDGQWRIVARQPIYEKDRIDPVDPAAVLRLDSALLNTFPAGCRHLLYLQSSNGMTVTTDVPALRGREVGALYRSAAEWLTPPEP
ncbi:nuclear transport factor 2 family protein [Pseudonocardia sp. GCM10023141]|uniref:nuclear transport factor 2 family protein n=1 Tax=Pseudonocardia sp. GCM10023141 TaxID=3252653 RepID=UPI0036125834